LRLRHVPTAARLVRAAAILAALSCSDTPVAAPPDLPAVGGQVSLLRFPRTGGPVEAYHPDSLGRPYWVTTGKVPPIHRLLGPDLDERIAWAVDSRDTLIAVDLESRAVRRQPVNARAGVVGPDGALYITDARHRVKRVLRRTPAEFQDSLPGVPVALFGAANDHLVVVTGGSQPQLVTSNAERTLHSTVLPAGEVSATFWGDLIAVAADTAVVLYETVGGSRAITPLRTRNHARRVAFSPSGHRLYVSTDEPGLTVYDRFTLNERAKIELPAPPSALRVDASGRWMLARPPGADSVWVVDLATNLLSATVAGSWGPDLPMIAGAATLITRLGNDIASVDLRQTPPRVIASLQGGGDDLWMITAWVPRDRATAAVAAAASATVAQDSALVRDSVGAQGDSTGVFLQVSTSQNPDWAAQLSRQLKEAGFPSRVLEPRGPDDGYRVVVGPYPNRDVAEENGRKLGRPFFILRESTQRP
jgi:hypothetical protein